MPDPVKFDRPLRATHHCRHYSYNTAAPLNDPARGPCCAAGVDMSAPGSSTKCMPDPTANCSSRQEYTPEERAAWEMYAADGINRLGNAIQALPLNLPERSSGTVKCPNCGGTLSYMRWRGGAGIECSTPNCCEARLNIDKGAKWPVGGGNDG